jgi:3-oxoacyl-[acyl-carrier protein] reductase
MSAMLEERVALVTGAGRGIGEAVAHALHDRGAMVIAADIDAAALSRSPHTRGSSDRRWRHEVLDVRDHAAIDSLVGRIVAGYGRIDVLVNNAARTVSRSFWEIDAEEWDEILATNLRSVFFACQLAGRHMRAREYGRIINLSSLAGQQGGLVAGAHYAAAKAGIIVLTKIVAAELAPHGVTVNAIAPAAISGPVMDGLSEADIQGLVARIPVGRVGTPEEVAALVAFLASDEAAYITGATYDINGGVFMR